MNILCSINILDFLLPPTPLMGRILPVTSHAFVLTQPISAMQLWSQIHRNYGEELGGCSSDDDYVRPKPMVRKHEVIGEIGYKFLHICNATYGVAVTNQNKIISYDQLF